MVDEVRRRVQQDTLEHRGRKGDPLFGTRRTLQIVCRTPHRQTSRPARRQAHPRRPHHEVSLAWQWHQKLRHIYQATPARGRELIHEVIASIPACPIPEISRLGCNPQAMEDRDPGPCRHLRRLQRPHRSHRRSYRNHPQNRSRLPQLHQLQTPMPTRRRRPPPLPDQTNEPCLNAKGRWWTSQTWWVPSRAGRLRSWEPSAGWSSSRMGSR